MQRSLRSVRSAPSSLRAQYLHSSASTPTPSHIFNKTGTAYKNLTVDNLKAECRKRGLKVSGNKKHLIDRLAIDDSSSSFSTLASPPAKAKSKAPRMPLTPQPKNISTVALPKTPLEAVKVEKASPMKKVQQEAVRTFHATQFTKAKDDDSTIDFYHMPKVSVVKEPLAAVFIPVIPGNLSVQATTPAVDVASSRPEIHHVSGDNVAQPIQDALDNYSVAEADSNEYTHDPNELQSRDKLVLTSLLAGTLAWFGLGKLTEDKH
ncbi:hypothetical protein BZA70DRAFT_287872 [Myxozyma melibiosi]|uniref:SAP domain-containing protein n=1 Tax=Myxozyma melibiosi TaxID=54550 RepID=A0ABR1FFN3_9ASCO